jgi:hypothetical protein
VRSHRPAPRLAANWRCAPTLAVATPKDHRRSPAPSSPTPRSREKANHIRAASRKAACQASHFIRSAV